MPCTKCRSDFNLLNWKIKCGECDDKYCSKCLKKLEGIFYCDKCTILIKRPPDPRQLMELKPKDLQEYLNKHNISTYGLVEKQELVELLCNRHIPRKPRRGVDKLTANFAGSVPNIRTQFNEFLENVDPRVRTNHNRPPTSEQPRPQPRAQPRPPPEPEPELEPEPQPTTSTSPQESLPTPDTTTIEVNVTPESSPLPPKYPKLTDFDSVEDLSNLSSKQLKQLLTLNRVDFKGCVEKTELLDRAKRLWEDNHEQTKELPENVQDLCKLCMDAPLDCVLLECGHIATCIDCGKKLAECPICRQYVIRIVRTFKA